MMTSYDSNLIRLWQQKGRCRAHSIARKLALNLSQNNFLKYYELQDGGSGS